MASVTLGAHLVELEGALAVVLELGGELESVGLEEEGD